MRYYLSWLWNSNVEEPQDISENFIVHPTISTAMFYLTESKIQERSEIYQLISSNRHFRTLKFLVSSFYSPYLLCVWILDLLDILSNELFFSENQIEFHFDVSDRAWSIAKIDFISEFKTYIRRNIPFLQRNRVLPVYIKFLVEPDFHIDYCITLNSRFHILFIKVDIDCIRIQRINFGIDL
jgi:hypothetical protein